MPLKWKLFRIANYFQAALGLGISGFVIYDFGLRDSGNIPISLLVITFPLSLVSNSIINIYLLEKYFPENMFARGLSRASRVFFVLSLITLALLLALAIFALTVLFFINRSVADEPNTRGRITLLILVLVISTGIYICRMQIVLRK